MQRRHFGAGDIALHAPYFRFLAANFPRVTSACWQAWADRGGWTGKHEVFALLDGDIFISAVARARMALVIDGTPVTGFQLAAVATLAEHRKRGLNRQLMDWVLAQSDGPVILFANAGAEDYYPQFGFRRVPQARATAPLAAAAPAAPAIRCDPDDPADRARLARLSARTRPHGQALTVSGYHEVILWHMGCRGTSLFWLPEHDAAVAASVEGERLVIHDVLAATPFDLAPSVPRLAGPAAAVVEFRFDPAGWWRGYAVAPLDDFGSMLFVRGAGALAGPVQFPALAHV